LWVAARKVAERYEGEQHDDEPEGRQPGRAPTVPSHHPARHHGKRVDGPRQYGEENLRVVQRHRLHVAVLWRERTRFERPDDADDEAERQERPSCRRCAGVHAVEDLQRWQARVEVTEVLLLDFLELQHVGGAEHAGESEAGIGEQERRHMDPEPRAVQQRVAILNTR